MPLVRLPRSTFYHRGERPRAVELDQALVELVGRLIAENPDYGLRRLTVLVRRELRAAVNRKRIHRILKANGWQIRQRPRGQRPRARGWVSRVADPTDRRAVVISLTQDGRAALARKQREYLARRRQIADALDPHEQEVAARLLRRLAAVIEEL